MRVRSGLLLLALIAAGITPAQAAPIFGFNESFSAPGTAGWGGGVPTISNPGSGGVGGAGDGYLLIGSLGGSLATRCKSCPGFTGDWTAAGITHIGLSLNDVGTDDPLEVHFAIGSETNFWLYVPGFDPPHDAWARFVVDLTNPADFVQLIGPGTFADALLNVTVVHVRHDTAPFVKNADFITADLGIDDITIGDLMTPVERGSWGRLKVIYR